jgi:hypothetical protein
MVMPAEDNDCQTALHPGRHVRALAGAVISSEGLLRELAHSGCPEIRS